MEVLDRFDRKRALSLIMTGRSTLRVGRLAAIRRLLDGRDALSIGELTHQLGVSEATVRRDLEQLQADGLVQRTHGGAVPVTHRVHEPPYPERHATHVEAKKAIGKAAMKFVSPGDTIFIGGGSTTLRFAEQLSAIDLTVVTNSLPVANELSRVLGVDVIVIGGELRTPELSMIGPRAVESIRTYRGQTAFLGVPALDANHGFTADGDAEAATDAAFISMARSTVVLADHTKLGRVSTTHVVPLSMIHTIVTDDGASALSVAELQGSGAQVVVAEVSRHG